MEGTFVIKLSDAVPCDSRLSFARSSAQFLAVSRSARWSKKQAERRRETVTERNNKNKQNFQFPSRFARQIDFESGRATLRLCVQKSANFVCFSTRIGTAIARMSVAVRAASEKAWLQDLATMLAQAQARFGDVSWQTETGEAIWAHKAIVYSRAAGHSILCCSRIVPTEIDEVVFFPRIIPASFLERSTRQF